jgi:RNA polymerase sigma-70 factor (ECF subfamily)
MELKPPDTRLIAGLSSGDPDAYAALFDRLAKPLLRMAEAMLNDRAEAEDAVQDLFLSLVRSREKLRRVDDLDAYVFACGRNVIRTRMSRRKTEQRRLQLLARSASPPAEPGTPDEGLKDALASLPADQREVVVLKIDGELTFKQIGQVLRMSPHTAASRYRYAMQKLQRRLSDSIRPA